MSKYNYGNFFNDFNELNSNINLYMGISNYVEVSNNYKSMKIKNDKKYVQYFINDIRSKCKRLKFNHDFVKIIDDFNNFYDNYADDTPLDYVALQNFTCMVSTILNNLNDNIMEFNSSGAYSYKNLYQIYDPSSNMSLKMKNVQSALSSDFLSRSIFHFKNEIKYIAKGSNGGVNLISVNTGKSKFNVIEKYMLKTKTPLETLFSILREYIIGTQLLYNVRKYTPNFTSVYGIYISNDHIPYTFESTVLVDYLRKENNDDLTSIINEYIYNGYYERNKKLNIANINNDNQTLYIMTEYSEGISFSDFLINVVENNDIDKVYDIIGIFAQIYRSLILAYNLIGYVHNDLHCSNIMIHEQKKECYIPEMPNFTGKHNSQKIKYLAQIIDYGYSSVNKYVNYNYLIFSNEKTNVHTDIIRLYTSVLKKLYLIRKQGYDNQTLDLILKYTTMYIGSYYFKKYNSYGSKTNINLYKNVLDDYYNSGLYNNFEYLSDEKKETILSRNLNDGFDFYIYFIKRILKSPDYEKFGFSNVPKENLYDFTKLEKSKSYDPVDDINLTKILDNLQPDGLTDDQYKIIKKSFDDYYKLCNQVFKVYNDNSINFYKKVIIIVSFYHCIINFSKYMGLNTFLIYYSKKSNIIPPILRKIFDGNMHKNLLIVLKELKRALDTIPDSEFKEKEMNQRALFYFEQYFTI